MTPEQYLALPEEKPYLEYVDGMVLQKPMPTEDHGALSFEIGLYIRRWTGDGGESNLGVEVRTRLGELPNFRTAAVINLLSSTYWESPR